MLGTIVNIVAVIIGSLLGLVFHKQLPAKIIKSVFVVIGLFTLFLGFQMASQTSNILVLVFSLLIGTIWGEYLELDKRMERFGEKIKRKTKSKSDNFVEGFVTSSLLFCVGSMAILGSIEEGLGGFPNLLLTKSILDGFASIALASGLGIGVVFSIIPLFLYQGSITILASYIQTFFSEIIINEMTAVGGLMMLGLGISLLELKEIKVVNMLPGLIISIVLSVLFL